MTKLDLALISALWARTSSVAGKTIAAIYRINNKSGKIYLISFL